MERKFVRLADIIIDRKLVAGDDISGLAKHIQATGLEVPVLLTDEMELIDGLRRLEAVRSSGATVIEAFIVSKYSDACSVLALATSFRVEAQELTPLRIWQLSQFARELAERERSEALTGRRKGSPSRGRSKEQKDHRRKELSTALGFKSQGRVQAICYVYRAATYDKSARGDLARELLPQLEAGASPYILAEMVSGRDTRKLYGDIVKASEQRESLRIAVSELNGIARGLLAIGPPNPSLSREEVEQYVKGLVDARTKISRFISLFRREETQR